MWKNTTERGRPEMTKWCMCIEYWIPKAKNTHSQYVILISFPLQQWLYECASTLRYSYIACLATNMAITSTLQLFRNNFFLPDLTNCFMKGNRYYFLFFM